jgi:hypothetical protein
MCVKGEGTGGEEKREEGGEEEKRGDGARVTIYPARTRPQSPTSSN